MHGVGKKVNRNVMPGKSNKKDLMTVECANHALVLLKFKFGSYKMDFHSI